MGELLSSEQVGQAPVVPRSCGATDQDCLGRGSSLETGVHAEARAQDAPNPSCPLGLRRQEEAGLSLSQTLVVSRLDMAGGGGEGSDLSPGPVQGAGEHPRGPNHIYESPGSRWSESGQHGGAWRGLQKQGWHGGGTWAGQVGPPHRGCLLPPQQT